MIEMNRSRLQVQVDKELVEGVKAKIKTMGLDQSSLLSAFITNVAYAQKLPFKSELSEREKAMAQAAAVFAVDSQNVPEIKSQADINEWYKENGDDE